MFAPTRGLEASRGLEIYVFPEASRPRGHAGDSGTGPRGPTGDSGTVPRGLAGDLVQGQGLETLGPRVKYTAGLSH